MKMKLTWTGPVPGQKKLFGLIRDSSLGTLEDLTGGQLIVDDPFGRRTLGENNGPVHEMEVLDRRFYPRLLLSGSIGLGEMYAEGWWETDDLAGTLTLLARNRDCWMELSRYNPLNFVHWLVNWNRKNTLEGSRENIRDHYDLGNDFYELFLDETLTYSCAYFRSPDQSLRDAQIEKLDRVCRKLELAPDHSILEIGSGWGSFAVYAAENYHCEVTTTTISDSQYNYVSELVAERGLENKITVLKKDYRNLRGNFDRVVSLEMIEAVGESYLSTYFQTLNDLLTSTGQIFLQGIYIREQFYESYRSTVDFIQRYIFPGGHLPSLGRLNTEIGKTSLAVKEIEDIGDQYVRTLVEWEDRFLENQETIKALGFDEYFLRLWKYYFAYCQAGFNNGIVGDFQLVLHKPEVLRN